MPMSPNAQMEQLSSAYLRAVVAAAGFGVDKPEIDDKSIDYRIDGYLEPDFKFEPKLELQLKCTASDYYRKQAAIPFDLRRKNYNDLCRPALIPRILVVVVIPENPDLWLEQTEEHLLLRYCGYWLSLAGQLPISSTKKRIYLKRSNIFNVVNLRIMMETIGKSGDL